ncbi:MAG TPA: cupin domain-containing protein [Polyangiaceae bacterium]
MKPHRDDLPEFLRDAIEQEPALDRDVAMHLPEMLEPAPMAPRGFDRLVNTVAAAPMVYAPFYDRLADLWGVDENEVLRVLTKSGEPGGWGKGSVPGAQAIGVGHPASAPNVSTRLARFAPGFRFPKHRHTGPEAVLVLRGSYTDSTGRVVRAGDWQEMKSGSEHALSVHKGEPCIIGVRQEGMEFTGPVMKVLARTFRR